MSKQEDNRVPEDDESIKSKSQLKREMHALQDLGKRMMDLSDDQLTGLPMSETLKAAIVESRRIHQHEARRRHLQYVGKVIRNEVDPEALRRAVEAFDAGSEEHTRRHHLAERWRDRLIEEGNPAVSGFVEQCPATDVQHLRNLLRNAQKDVKTGKNTGQARKLFRYLRECIDESEKSA
ncbi:ribosome biogenesis factor YjgA [Marinobacter sp. AN1]|uniref:ribosome biogenesis factor YjgA n=1 Tax=Marinobacter sp. AN1 TaxID=2886046 RepID=UPI00223056DF|nr:ribosome biogenesis factor YjgA [Marinobacter sp. AN1]UZD67014.1 DUF615 domain-containing protein [Marinobacter sp. AN1]